MSDVSKPRAWGAQLRFFDQTYALSTRRPSIRRPDQETSPHSFVIPGGKREKL
jgi:hypothetical protein